MRDEGEGRGVDAGRRRGKRGRFETGERGAEGEIREKGERTGKSEVKERWGREVRKGGETRERWEKKEKGRGFRENSRWKMKESKDSWGEEERGRREDERERCMVGWERREINTGRGQSFVSLLPKYWPPHPPQPNCWSNSLQSLKNEVAVIVWIITHQAFLSAICSLSLVSGNNDFVQYFVLHNIV